MYGCYSIHALKDCPQMKVAVYVHSSFDLDAVHSLYTSMRCSACAGGCVGDPYLRDDDDNVVEFDDRDCRMCEHCDLSCWCDQREWIDIVSDDDSDSETVAESEESEESEELNTV